MYLIGAANRLNLVKLFYSVFLAESNKILSIAGSNTAVGVFTQYDTELSQDTQAN